MIKKFAISSVCLWFFLYSFSPAFSFFLISTGSWLNHPVMGNHIGLLPLICSSALDVIAKWCGGWEWFIVKECSGKWLWSADNVTTHVLKDWETHSKALSQVKWVWADTQIPIMNTLTPYFLKSVLLFPVSIKSSQVVRFLIRTSVCFFPLSCRSYIVLNIKLHVLKWHFGW